MCQGMHGSITHAHADEMLHGEIKMPVTYTTWVVAWCVSGVFFAASSYTPVLPVVIFQLGLKFAPFVEQLYL